MLNSWKLVWAAGGLARGDSMAGPFRDRTKGAVRVRVLRARPAAPSSDPLADALEGLAQIRAMAQQQALQVLCQRR